MGIWIHATTAIILLLSIFVFYRKIAKQKLLNVVKARYRMDSANWRPRDRSENLDDAENSVYDLLIIGGGASGVGCALESATRGLRTILIEADDFGSETSSKSTKLLHGGVRYLKKALLQFNLHQLLFVWNALAERYRVMSMIPYLAYSVPIMVPLHSKWLVPLYWAMFKIYDKLGYPHALESSYYVAKKDLLLKKGACRSFNSLNAKQLEGAIVYTDGMFDDSRANVILAMTVAYYGGTVLNYVNLNSFELENGKVVGASCTDKLTGRAFTIKAKGYISATGPFTDKIRKKNINKETLKRTEHKFGDIMAHSAGTHVVVPAISAPIANSNAAADSRLKNRDRPMGLLITSTGDGRMLFILPWKSKILIGSTEEVRSLEKRMQPESDEIKFLFSELKGYFTEIPRENEILAAWTGVRPLIKQNKESTENMIRSYEIISSRTGVLYLTGGKWTILRKMGEDCIERAIREFGLSPANSSVSKYIVAVGGEPLEEASNDRERKASDNMAVSNGDKSIVVEKLGVSEEYADHLLKYYGSRALAVGPYVKRQSKRLSTMYPFLAGEVIYCVENEGACTLSGIINNRFTLGYMDVREAVSVSEEVTKILSEYFGWTGEEEHRQRDDFMRVAGSLGYSLVLKNRA